MSEAQTRLNKIDSRLRDAVWSIAPDNKILAAGLASCERDTMAPGERVVYY